MIELECLTPDIVKFENLAANDYFVLSEEFKNTTQPRVYRVVSWPGEMNYAVEVKTGIIWKDIKPTNEVHPLEAVFEKVKLKYIYGSVMEDEPENNNQYSAITDQEYEVNE